MHSLAFQFTLVLLSIFREMGDLGSVIGSKTVCLVRDNYLGLVAHVRHLLMAVVHEALVCIITILVHLLGIMGSLLSILLVLHILLSSIMSVIDFTSLFLGHFATWLPDMHIFEVRNPMRL